MSAYRSSPYFDMVAERLKPFYTTHFESLVEYNLALLSLLLDIIGYTKPLRTSESYVTATEADIWTFSNNI